ncbi:adenine-specific DNA-methyltransferase [Brevibacterium linens]|uniref:site-specific DNA-methyltransferase (adenine-specific) n=2 Tax=Brevibacterium linens TaxID=1703 RepID=A0A2H1KLR6_BRELN|nr:adenine-specific DNA-methyltransferase [Brevibacterium linens]
MMPAVKHDRPLGARGSRRSISSAGAHAELSPTASAVLTALPAWWSARAERAGLSGIWLDVNEAVDADPPFSTSVPPQLEEEWGPLSGEEVGEAYVNALSSATRSRHGRHYTPSRLSAHLWAQARTALGVTLSKAQPLDGLVRDPACGAGALLLPALKEHLRATTNLDPRLVIAGLPELIEGIDNDPAAIWIANLILAAEMLPLLARLPEHNRRPLPALCRVGDGLAPTDKPARVVLMNPPYGRVKLADEERARFADVVYGHANLYSLFMAAAEEGLDSKGILAALVPTSFLAGRYFSPLRERLSSSVRLKDIAFVERRSGVFSTVLQETCLATFTRKRVRLTSVSSLGETDMLTIARVPSPRGDQPWILPRRTDLAAVAASASQMPLTLASSGWRVSTGPLVWNRRVEDLNPDDGTPVIWSADFDGGKLHTDERRSAMRFMRLHSDRDRRVMTLSEPAVLVQRTSAPEQSRRLTSTHLTQMDLERLGGEIVIENHVNVLRPTTDDPAMSITLLNRLLWTPELEAVARCISGSVALSAFELSALPFPCADTLAEWESLDDDELQREVARMYRIGLP